MVISQHYSERPWYCISLWWGCTHYLSIPGYELLCSRSMSSSFLPEIANSEHYTGSRIIPWPSSCNYQAGLFSLTAIAELPSTGKGSKGATDNSHWTNSSFPFTSLTDCFLFFSLVLNFFTVMLVIALSESTVYVSSCLISSALARGGAVTTPGASSSQSSNGNSSATA